MEIYDPRTNTWERAGDLPGPVSGGQLIEDGRGGVLLVGGDNVGKFSGYKGHGYTSDIFYLPGKGGIWSKTFKTIDIPRQFHVALLISDSFVHCL